MADNSSRPPSAQHRTVRAQKIQVGSPTTPHDEERDEALDRALPIRGQAHTPGHSSSQSQSHTRRKASESSLRTRSQSVTAKTPATSSSSSSQAFNSPASQPARTPTPKPTSNGVTNGNPPSESQVRASSSSAEGKESETKKRAAPRITSTMPSKPSTSSGAVAPPRKSSAHPHRSHDRSQAPYVSMPPIQEPKNAPEVPTAPSSGMYWCRAPVSGASHTPLRAHTTTLVGSNVFVFGGCDSRTCFNELYVLDADSFHWSHPHVCGDVPTPLRAMTCTAVGKKLIVFGGGDGPAYYNDVHVFDTVNFRWHKPRIIGDKVPSARRAHTACLYKSGIYVFGGGDGVRALNDIWRLDVSDLHKMSWSLVSKPSSGSPRGDKPKARGDKPKARGYHTANMVGSKLIIYGGSDGGECFNDVWIYDVEMHIWRAVSIPVTYRRLSHTATIVGSYLFVIGGHDGNEYSNDVILLNLVTMQWDKRKVYGVPPSGRGYHGTVLYDSRLIVIGGFNGDEVFGDVWILELAVHAYYSQISHFTIEV